MCFHTAILTYLSPVLTLVHIHTHTRTHRHTQTHRHTHTHTYSHIHILTYSHSHTHTHIELCVYFFNIMFVLVETHVKNDNDALVKYFMQQLTRDQVTPHFHLHSAHTQNLHTHTLTHTHSHTHTHTHSLTQTLTLTHTHTHSQSPTLTHTHTHTHIHTRALIYIYIVYVIKKSGYVYVSQPLNPSYQAFIHTLILLYKSNFLCSNPCFLNKLKLHLNLFQQRSHMPTKRRGIVLPMIRYTTVTKYTCTTLKLRVQEELQQYLHAEMRQKETEFRSVEFSRLQVVTEFVNVSTPNYPILVTIVVVCMCMCVYVYVCMCMCICMCLVV